MTSICRHGELTTVYSYVFDVSVRGTTLYVCQGNPCRGEYRALPIHFPADAVAVAATLDAYPSTATQAALSAATRESHP